MPRSRRPERRLGIDVGGTKVAAGLVDVGPRRSSCHLDGWSLRAARPELAALEMVEDVLDQVEALFAEQGRPARRVAAVGIGFPGDFEDGGPIRTAPNLPAFVGHSPAALFLEALRERFGIDVPVTAGNDACVAALAEACLGAGRGARRLLYLTVSTGVGGARFARSGAADSTFNVEPGLSLRPDPEQPDQPLEYLASGTAIATIARREIRAEVASGGGCSERSWSAFLDRAGVPEGDFAERVERLDARHLGRSAAHGEAFSRRQFDRAAGHVARGLALLLAEGFGEERVVLGGSVAAKVPRFLDQVRETLAELRSREDASAGLRALDLERDLVAAGLGEERGILGAALLTEPGVTARGRSPAERSGR